MPKIVINTCDHTSNIMGLSAVLTSMTDKEDTSSYDHEKTIYLDNGATYTVKERPMDLNNPTCSCEFNVSKIKDVNQVEFLSKTDDLKYQLETLSLFEPKDIDNPEFEVAYESNGGEESFATVCCIELAQRALKRIVTLENQINNTKESVK